MYLFELEFSLDHDAYNHDGVITHLEPDILECKVKWALGNISMNKASGVDRITAELFQSLNICKFSVHVLLKPGLENFEHYFTSV